MRSIPLSSDADSPPTLPPRRDALSFSIDRLSRRNEIVLKSSMRVLDHRFLHRWSVVDCGGDVRVTTQTDDASPGAGEALRLGANLIPDTFLVPLPLRAHDLESAFNRMGKALVRARNLQRTDALRGPRDDEVFHLQRWPSDALLNAEHRLTLATLMSARPCSVETLQGRSALPLDMCRAFMRELMGSGLLRPFTETTTDSSMRAFGSERSSWSSAAPAPRSLLARIRARLGLMPNGSR